MGASIAEDDDCGETALVHGMVTGPDGTPVPDAVLDVWQNAANGRYAVQDDTQDPDNLRGRFTTGADGRFRFWSVRPTDYPLPTDGPVGEMIRATGRHPWRAAHLHLRVSAPGHRPVTTHLFDDGSRYLDSDTVFGVKPSLVCHYEHHGPDDPPGPDAPAGASAGWYSLERTVVLAPERD
jgi:catechol 1,2-dioxygenase